MDTTKKPKFFLNFISTIFLLLCTAVSSAEGKFDFTIIHDGNKQNEELASYIEEKGTFKKIIKALNESLTIPYDIHIILTSSDIGPYYSPSKKTIFLDYNDERWSAQQYDANYPDSDKETRDYYLNNINLFSLYHELGHALIDAYNIPMVGSEEDAADSLAAVMILYYFTEGSQILLDNADYFERAREASASQENQYWDVHALNEQRYYRLICYAYANDPKDVEEQLKEWDKEDQDDTFAKFLKEKSESCIWEYKSLNQSWFTLLKPHFKDSSEADEAIKEINNPNSTDEDTSDSTSDEDEDSDE
ncbi:DUF4344 domain-containing metallopeptidase [Legionella sp. km772]|uniref:DUF4344 domain-containing metallopeptidase n=1 Tax=Legionella sp. km772 TaxID=2498111 RepID=UPI000F8D10E0|nr:DUF4344 domain-containing metallopeptidase [Legionella sp. km772]RUR07964.1 hypothetical protein ELY15_11615 [Legionella sp. km772]